MLNIGDKVVCIDVIRLRRPILTKGQIYEITRVLPEHPKFGAHPRFGLVPCVSLAGLGGVLYAAPRFRKVIHDKPQAAVGNFADWFKILETTK